MPRKRRIPKLKRAPLSPALLAFFITGKDAGAKLVVEAPLEVHQRQRWSEHGALVMEIHLHESPGTRPYAWWRWEAGEPRRVLVGAEVMKPKSAPTSWDFWWREHRGVPAFHQIRPRGYGGVPSLESEAAYLDRLNLLTDEERGRLVPVDFAAEAHDPFRVSEEALEQARAAGGDEARVAMSLERDLRNPGSIRA